MVHILFGLLLSLTSCPSSLYTFCVTLGRTMQTSHLLCPLAPSQVQSLGGTRGRLGGCHCDQGLVQVLNLAPRIVSPGLLFTPAGSSWLQFGPCPQTQPLHILRATSPVQLMPFAQMSESYMQGLSFKGPSSISSHAAVHPQSCRESSTLHSPTSPLHPQPTGCSCSVLPLPLSSPRSVQPIPYAKFLLLSHGAEPLLLTGP